jgi:hypothetical protein
MMHDNANLSPDPTTGAVISTGRHSDLQVALNLTDG